MAEALAEINPHWNDETLFQQARRIHAAQMQIITYNEYLPSILNDNTMREYNLNLKTNGYNEVYRPNIADYQAIMNNDYKIVEKRPIEETYLNPHMVTFENGGSLAGIGRWLSADPTPLADGPEGYVDVSVSNEHMQKMRPTE
ncbi:PERC-like protein [Mya arenaria]|uniref:PERC-like protein n=1 Tax=Mya arenaria TaxID=6604 RepID=A0ABY7DAR9_MYAAR|nr:PERC-like protein [Mya arenaria]